MTFNLDTLIFVSFLIINLAVGLYYTRGVKTVREYAIGDRNFSISTLTITLVATCIGGGFFTPALVESYRQGIYFIIPALGEPIALIITGYFLIPKMLEFFGNLSIADTMGKIYGKNVRIIIGIAGVLYSIGVVALQLKIAGIMIKLFFNVSELYAIIISASLITLYSSLGGIKAVTFTDILQFGTFAIILPLICLSIWSTAYDDSAQVLKTITNNPLFDFKEMISIYNPRFFDSISLFLFFIIPAGDPAYIQRIGAAKGIYQAKKSFILAGMIIIVLLLLTCSTGVLLLGINPNLNPDDLLTYIISNYTYIGFKGLTAVCIMAIIMSTADSYINSASVLLVNDVIKFEYKYFSELMTLRVVALSFGVIATYLSYESGSIFQLGLRTLSFYMPIVSVPMLLAIFGFRSSSIVVINGMSAGAIVTLLWINFGPKGSNEIIPGMIANLIMFIIAHNVHRKHQTSQNIDYIKALRTPSLWRNTIYFTYNNIFDNFNFTSLYQKSFIKNDSLYILAGFFSLLCTFSMSYLGKNLKRGNIEIFNFIYFTSLLCSFALIIYPVLPQICKKKENVIAVFRTVTISYSLIITSLMFCFLNNFGQIQLSIFLLSVLIFMYIVRWRAAVILLFLTSIFTIYSYKLLTGLDVFDIEKVDITLKFKVLYIFLTTSTVLIAFFKPKQEEQELTEEKNAYLSDRINYQESEIKRALNLKKEFINNITHEYHAPMTGVISIAETLWEGYDNLSDKMRRDAAETIYRSAIKLDHFDSNINILSKLSNSHVTMNKMTVNLSRLVEERVAKCIKLYLDQDQKDQRKFKLEIVPNISLKCDEYYITKVIDNLVLNAISYCKAGEIKINLGRKAGNIEFMIEDEGIGIPPNEIFEIFGAFTVSSKTYSKAGGRGIGLTLCKMIVELHGGKIVAQSNGIKGARFKFILPTQ